MEWLLQVNFFLYMSQILTRQASHDSLNTRNKDLAVEKAYGMNGLDVAKFSVFVGHKNRVSIWVV
jgi:hypothetical protein